MKYLVFLASILVIAACTACTTTTTNIQDTEYKSAVDLYPEAAKKAGIIQLGETQEILGYEYRVFAECKSINADIWIQFIDTTVVEEIDNEPDFAVRIMLYEGELLMIDIYEVDYALEVVKYHCEENNVEYKGFIHFADPVRIRGDNEA